MATHDNFRALAKRLIDKHGREVVLVKSSSTVADVLKPWRGSDEPHTGPDGTTVDVTGVFVTVRERDEAAMMIKRGAMALLAAASDLSPEVDVSLYDAVRDGTRTWRIVAANVIDPGPQTILYTFEVEQ